jgi:heat-inducible transcriptional repressor
VDAVNAEERRVAVLRAIVADFVSTNEPVGSKALVERHNLGVSSATVRNDMAALEEEGYIAQPHTSAGRIPTDKGYRLFVDRLHQVKPLSAAERKAITQFLEGAVDLDDVLKRSVRLLAQLTRQVAVVQYPTLTRSTVRHLEVVRLTPARLMLVLITDTGRVDQRVVDLGDVLDEEDVSRLRTLLNNALVGQPLATASVRMSELPDDAPDGLKSPLVNVAAVLVEALLERPEERLVLGGTANLTRAGTDATALRGMLEALEEQVVVLRLLTSASDPGTVTVRIGEENESEDLWSASTVSIGYGSLSSTGQGSTALGGMGVVGPTRMDYPSAIAAVRAVARYVGEIVGGR